MPEETTLPIEYNVTDAALAELAERHKDVDAYKDLKAAKAAKKECRDIRLKIEKRRKELKKDALEYGRKVDAKAREIKQKIADVEDPLTEQLDEIANAEKRKEEERLARIQTEIDRITAQAEGRHDLTVEQLEERIAILELFSVTEEVFQERLDDANACLEESLSRLRITQRSARERAEEAERLEQQRKEQEAEAERLRKEREELEADKAEAKKKADAEADAKRKAEEERLAKEREELEEKQKAIDEENARLAKEKEEREAEEARQAEEARKLRLAPDCDKLTVWAGQIEDSVFLTPTVESSEAQRVVTLGLEKLKTAIQYIRNESEKLA